MNRLSCLRGKLLNFLHPFLHWASGKHLPYTHKKVTGLDYYEARKVLKPGSIFVTKIHGELTTLLIPGDFSHAAIYTPKLPTALAPWEFVTEAEGLGVIQTDLVSFMLSKDELWVLDTGLPPEVCARAAEIAAEQVGKPYDYELLYSFSDQKSFYCSELVWWSYARACAEFTIDCPFISRIELGEPTISPDNIAGQFPATYKSKVAV